MTTIADAARGFHERGWKPVPISRKTKKPIGKEWQKRPYDPAQFNDNAQNVGIQLGEASGGLADVDLDALTAIGFAPEFLPLTEAIFGHPSKPCSHQLYVSDLHKTEARGAIQYKQFLNGHQGQTIVELRIGGNQGKGIATVAPPSMHATGEPIAWVSNGEPARVDGAELMRAVRKLAVASLLKSHYPGQGSRHEGALVIGGVLARAAWGAEDIAHVVEVVARAAGDNEVADRVTTAASAVERKANGNDVAGFERLRVVWGEEVADTLKQWLRLRDLRADRGVGLEDTVALTFAAKHADGLRYIAKSNQWARWTGTCWREEPTTTAAFDEARKLCRTAGDARAKTVAGVITLARSDRRIAASTEQWDAGTTLFNTRKKE